VRAEIWGHSHIFWLISAKNPEISDQLSLISDEYGKGHFKEDYLERTHFIVTHLEEVLKRASEERQGSSDAPLPKTRADRKKAQKAIIERVEHRLSKGVREVFNSDTRTVSITFFGNKDKKAVQEMVKRELGDLDTTILGTLRAREMENVIHWAISLNMLLSVIQSTIGPARERYLREKTEKAENRLRELGKERRKQKSSLDDNVKNFGRARKKVEVCLDRLIDADYKTRDELNRAIKRCNAGLPEIKLLNARINQLQEENGCKSDPFRLKNKSAVKLDSRKWYASGFGLLPDNELKKKVAGFAAAIERDQAAFENLQERVRNEVACLRKQFDETYVTDENRLRRKIYQIDASREEAREKNEHMDTLMCECAGVVQRLREHVVGEVLTWTPAQNGAGAAEILNSFFELYQRLSYLENVDLIEEPTANQGADR